MSNHDSFLNPLCSPRTLDVYFTRRKILEALREQLGNLHGVLLDVGCGRMPYKPVIMGKGSRVNEYVGMDLQHDLRNPVYSGFGKPDLEWDGHRIPLEANQVDCAICTEVYEQLHDVEAVMRETARVLKPGGILFFTSPFFWPVHDAPFDQCRYTPFSLQRHLQNAGFESINMKSLGGWDASLGQMIGLWVRRRPMSPLLRRALSILAQPLVQCLTERDSPPPIFTDQTMITDIAGTAIKGR